MNREFDLEHSNHRLAIIGVGLAAVITVAMSSGYMTFWDTGVGLILVVVLHIFARPDPKNKGERWVYSLVFAISLSFIPGVFIDWLILTKLNWVPSEQGFEITARDSVYALFWIITSLIVFWGYGSHQKPTTPKLQTIRMSKTNRLKVE